MAMIWLRLIMIKRKYLNSFEQNKILPLLGVENKEILEVGVGTGRLAIRLANLGAKITAVDVSPQMLAVLKSKNDKVKIVMGDAENLPFSNDVFDLVIATF